MTSDAIRAAVEIINKMKDRGLDYSMHKVAIATAYDEGLLEGNSEAIVALDSSTLKDLRIIQEDHYDQHMDHDEDRPTWKDMLFSVCTVPSYVWFS